MARPSQFTYSTAVAYEAAVRKVRAAEHARRENLRRDQAGYRVSRSPRVLERYVNLCEDAALTVRRRVYAELEDRKSGRVPVTCPEDYAYRGTIFEELLAAIELGESVYHQLYADI